jgi:hypothetical protein
VPQVRVRVGHAGVQADLVGTPALQHGVEAGAGVGDAQRLAGGGGQRLRVVLDDVLEGVGVDVEQAAGGVGSVGVGDETVDCGGDVVGQGAHPWGPFGLVVVQVLVG